MDFNNLSRIQQSYLLIAVGSILFLYSLGVFKQAFQFIIVTGSLGLILYGLYLGNFLVKIKEFVLDLKNKIKK